MQESRSGSTLESARSDWPQCNRHLSSHTASFSQFSFLFFIAIKIKLVKSFGSAIIKTSNYNYLGVTLQNLKIKVEKIFKGNLDLIPSPSYSVKIQIMGRKVCLMCKGKTLRGGVNKLFGR